MSLLHQIQESIVKENVDLGSVLMKLRLLVSKLGSNSLEEWVKYESEGYPKDKDVPPYRIVPVTYTGTFSDPFRGVLNNMQIPLHLIKKFGGERWLECKIRESIAGVSNTIVQNNLDGNVLGVDASNLILILQGKVYEGYACNAVNGYISLPALLEIPQVVRNRILELTVKLEKSIPDVALITVEPSEKRKTNPEKTQEIFQQVIYGNVGTAVMGGHQGNITVNISKGDKESFIKHLVGSGMQKNDATAFADIVGSEKPSSKDDPFGKNAKNWIRENLKKLPKGTWNTLISIVKSVLKEATLRFYGFR